MMVTNYDIRFEPQKFTTRQLLQLWLESQGWYVFSSEYDFDNEHWIFGCEYMKENCDRYDKTTSYDIWVDYKPFDKGCNADIVVHPPQKR